MLENGTIIKAEDLKNRKFISGMPVYVRKSSTVSDWVIDHNGNGIDTMYTLFLSDSLVSIVEIRKGYIIADDTEIDLLQKRYTEVHPLTGDQSYEDFEYIFGYIKPSKYDELNN